MPGPPGPPAPPAQGADGSPSRADDRIRSYPGPPEVTVYPAAERITVALLAALRTATLVLGGIEIAGAAKGRSHLTAFWLLAALACLSAVMFARAARRLAARTPRWPFDAVTVWAETAAGVAALLILAHVTAPEARAGTGFWAEPYTVISAVLIGATARRVWAGGLAVVGLAGAYLVSVLSAVAGPPALGQASVTAAWTNATSYLAFFAVAAMGFRLLRNIIGQAEQLRQMIERLSAERTRVAAASTIWRIGHDIPKALLREVRRPTLPAGVLREQAPLFRAELLSTLVADPRAPVHLRAELARIANISATWMRLDVDLAAMRGQPSGLPALLMAEAVRELLNNASYHRHGYPARLTGTSSAEHVEVCVHNEGPGADPQRLALAWARRQNTLHLFEAAGGSYAIHSVPEADGTTVVLRYPGASARGTTAT
jgi:hypothetical protein